jgi:parvulin-like peptidyl-prolyl isomerase
MTAPQALAEAIKTHRAQIESDFIKGATISFEFYKDPNYFKDEKTIEARKEKLAKDAWQRLQKGDAFDKVAKEMSDDASASKGGQLGCVRADYLGREIEVVWRKLKPR